MEVAIVRGEDDERVVEHALPVQLLQDAPAGGDGAASQEEPLKAAGFEKVEVPETQFFPGEINRVSLYQKQVAEGERLRFRKLFFLVMGEGTEIEKHRSAPPIP